MARIIYGQQVTDKSGLKIREDDLPAFFAQARAYNQRLLKAGRKVAYFFIDPLLFSFEAGNRFYFKVLQTPRIDKLNYYRSGAGPIHALSDARQLIDHHLYDAVFIFGFEPLLTGKKIYGSAALSRAMDIFNGPNLLSCYNGLAVAICRKYGLAKEDFLTLADLLYRNYCHTYEGIDQKQLTEARPRGRFMEDRGAPLFRITDCANPNLDFAGGIIVANNEAADLLAIANQRQLDIISVQHAMVEADPEDLSKISGGELFPHLSHIFTELKQESGIDLCAESAAVMLDAYTCYPPIPLAFLICGGFMETPRQLEEVLAARDITINGGLSLAGAPWNNPVLSSLVSMYEKLPAARAHWGLVHGNGGIGEAQGLALLQKVLV